MEITITVTREDDATYILEMLAEGVEQQFITGDIEVIMEGGFEDEH